MSLECGVVSVTGTSTGDQIMPEWFVDSLDILISVYYALENQTFISKQHIMQMHMLWRMPAYLESQIKTHWWVWSTV